MTATPALADPADCNADLAAMLAAREVPVTNPANPLADRLPADGSVEFEDGRCLIQQMETPISTGAEGQKLLAGPVRWQIEWGR